MGVRNAARIAPQQCPQGCPKHETWLCQRGPNAPLSRWERGTLQAGWAAVPTPTRGQRPNPQLDPSARSDTAPTSAADRPRNYTKAGNKKGRRGWRLVGLVGLEVTGTRSANRSFF
jgi:hypothetical protein